MTYEYEKNVVAEIKELGARYKAPSFYAMADEVEEVYAKAKAFNEILALDTLPLDTSVNMYEVESIIKKFKEENK